MFSANLGPKRPMLSGRAIYVLGPLQISDPEGAITAARALLGSAHETEIYAL